MIENIRKNYKLSKLLNLFHISILSCIVMIFINHIGVFDKSEFIKQMLGPLPLFFAVVGFSMISMCVLAYLGNLKEVYNVIWFGKISTLVIVVITSMLLTRSLVTRESVNSFGVMYTLLGVVCSMLLIKNVDKK